MYNLLMRSSTRHDEWQLNQGRPYDVSRLFSDRSFGDRVFEHTDDAIKKSFASGERPDFDALMKLPCLFTYEGVDAVGAIGRISEVRFEGRTFEITYTLPPVYPPMRMNSDPVFESLRISVGRYEQSRTHWAVKDVDLFEVATRLLHDQGNAPIVLPEREMRNVWGNDYQRNQLVFLSHNALHSRQVAEVKTHLEQQRLSCFLAHQDITPSTIWSAEILKALNTMDIFIGFVTDDFQRGGWTDQEIGYAVQRRIPRVFVKLGDQDPVGMVAPEQALNADWEDASKRIIAHLRGTGEL